MGPGCFLQAPEYMLERDPNADEHGSTCLLRFTAGPPYEDVYFKILNKEWGARLFLAYCAGEQLPASHLPSYLKLAARPAAC